MVRHFVNDSITMNERKKYIPYISIRCIKRNKYSISCLQLIGNILLDNLGFSQFDTNKFKECHINWTTTNERFDCPFIYKIDDNFVNMCTTRIN